MAVVYSARFVAAKGLSGTASYLVPAGYLAVVRDADGFAGSQAVTPELVMLGSAAQIIWQIATAPLTRSWQSWRGRQVLEAGEVLSVQALNGDWDISVSGYLLSLP